MRFSNYCKSYYVVIYYCYLVYRYSSAMSCFEIDYVFNYLVKHTKKTLYYNHWINCFSGRAVLSNTVSASAHSVLLYRSSARLVVRCRSSCEIVVIIRRFFHRWRCTDTNNMQLIITIFICLSCLHIYIYLYVT